MNVHQYSCGISFFSVTGLVIMKNSMVHSVESNATKALFVFIVLAACGCGGRNPGTVQDFRDYLRTSDAPSADALVATFFEVGLGDAILLEFPDGHTLMIDAGMGWHADFILNYLEARGIAQIDGMLLTHPHIDHYGGMLTLLKRIKVNQFFDNGLADKRPEYRELLNLLREKGIPRRVLRRGDNLNSLAGTGTEIEVLYPDEKALTLRSSPNTASIVLRISHGQTVFLLTGDTEKDEEQRLLEMEQNKLAATVLKLGHHGSMFTGTLAFLQRVNPEVAIAQGTQLLGIPPFYARPSYHIRSTLRRMNVPLLTTEHEGTIQVISDGQSMRWRTMVRSIEEAELKARPAALP